jgi:hypothetical protein
VSGQCHAPAALHPYAFDRRLSELPELVWKRWRGERVPASNGNQTSVVRSVVKLLC